MTILDLKTTKRILGTLFHSYSRKKKPMIIMLYPFRQSGYMRMSSTIKRQSKHPQDLSPTESNNSLEVLNQNLNEGKYPSFVVLHQIVKINTSNINLELTEVVTHDPSSNSQQEMDDASSPMLTPWQFPKNPGGPLNLAYSTQDLIVWSWQVARGMKHLANKKVI